MSIKCGDGVCVCVYLCACGWAHSHLIKSGPLVPDEEGIGGAGGGVVVLEVKATRDGIG